MSDAKFEGTQAEWDALVNKNKRKELTTEVFEAMGEVSMCWNPRPTGVFDSSEAKRIGDELMKKIESDIPNAVTVITKEMLSDKSEGSYYYSWQANIAMAFQDEYRRWAEKFNVVNDHPIHSISNQAAKNFLDLLCSKL